MPDTRKPRDHLEVRCAETMRLLGWLKGIDAKNVAHEPLMLTDPNDAMVVEDEGGVVEELGFAMELDTCEIVQQFGDFQSHEALKEIHRWVPSYAARARNPMAGIVIYTWVAVLADHEDYVTLFDFPNFEPWGVPNKDLVAAETEFHTTQLLRDAKSLLKGSYRSSSSIYNASMTNAAIDQSKLSGTKAEFVIMDELAEMDGFMDAMAFTPPAPKTATIAGQLSGLSKSLTDLGKASGTVSESLRKASQNFARRQDGMFLRALTGQRP